MVYISSTHEVELFIKENVTFIIARSFTKPTFLFPTETVGLLKKSDINGFLEAIKKDTARECEKFEDSQWSIERYNTAHVCQTSKGNMFITSHMGLFLIVDIVFDEKDYFIKYGIKTLWPLKTQELMDAGKLPRLKPHYKTLGNTSNEMIISFIEEEKQKEDQAALKRQERAMHAKRLEDFLGPMNKDLFKSLMEYDFFYSFSDDINVYRAGVSKEKELKAMAVTRGFNCEEVFTLTSKARS